MSTIERHFSERKIPEETKRLICSECDGLTIHSIIYTYEERGSEEFYNDQCTEMVDWLIQNQTIQCNGCEKVSFRTIETNCENTDEYGQRLETIVNYPMQYKSPSPIDTSLLPNQIQRIYTETISSLENGQFILAGIGIRAIVETICKDLDANGRDLYEKINSLQEKSIVTKDGAGILHQLRVLGNNAAHEVKAHDSKQLELAMQIIQHMLDGTYFNTSKNKGCVLINITSASTRSSLRSSA